ncbi:MAG: NADH-quinone oxidoreductase subunit C [Planctomycetota bacterium]|nr:MAG: NADH-quinone oxidoreductase subunit C [Planctomycetota bacterium]
MSVHRNEASTAGQAPRTPAEQRWLEAEHQVLARLERRFPQDVVLGSRVVTRKLWIDIAREALLEVLRFLRDDPELRFEMLIELTCADFLKYPGHQGPRFALLYILYSFRCDAYVRLKVWLEEDDPRAPSATAVFAGAEWPEREVYDLYGIVFEGHPDLRRLLMPDDFTGHPLRKDYPLRGRGERDSFPVLTREES